MLLGILQCDSVIEELRDRHGDYPDMFRQLLSAADPSLQFRVYNLPDGEFPQSPQECDAWLLTGSKWSVYDEALWIRRAEELVRQLHAASRPTVGICFGHQLIARALGGAVRKSARGWGVGIHETPVHNTRPWMQPLQDKLALVVSHQDQVETLPADAEPLAGSDFCPIAMFQIGEHILTFQGHPEFSKAYGREMLERRRDIVGEATYQRGLQSLVGDSDAETAAGWILRFLKR